MYHTSTPTIIPSEKDLRRWSWSQCPVFFFFNDPPTTEIHTYCHTLSLHDALPISPWLSRCRTTASVTIRARSSSASRGSGRSEEHTSELQSLRRISYAVFCLK